MLRLYLMLLVLVFNNASGQQKSEYLLLAEKLKAISTLQSIQPARKAFIQSVQQKDNYNACLAGTFLGDAYRKLGNYDTAIHYDSLAVLYAKQRHCDTLLQQKAINSYARNFVEGLQCNEAEAILIKNTALFTSYYTIETCRWYEMRALNNFNRIRIGDAISLSRKAQEVARFIHDSVALMHANMMVFKFQSMLLQSDNMDLAFNALTYFEKTKDNVYAAQAANIIGYAFETTHNLDKAMEYYERALQHNTSTSNKKEIMYSLMHIADVHKGRGAFELAKPLLYEEFRYFSSIHFPKGIASATIRLAKIYSDTEQFDSAIIFFKITDKLNKQMNLKVLTLGSYAWQAQMQAKLKNFRESDSLAELAIAGMLQEQHQEISQMGLNRVKEAGTITDADMKEQNRFLTRKNFTTVKLPPARQKLTVDYERLKKYNWQTGASTDKDSTYIEKNSRQQLEAESKYKVNTYRDTLKIEKQNTGKANKKIHSLNWILLGVAVMLLLVSTVLYHQYKGRRQAERDKTWKEQLRKEAHHRVFNNLGIVKSIVEKLGKATPEQMSIDALITRIDSIVLLHKHLYQNSADNEKVFLQTYLQKLIQSLLAIYESGKAIQVSVDAAVEADTATALNLGLIVNELITNSLKYAFTGMESGSIYITAVKKGGQMRLNVVDNGIGLSANRKTGYGSKLIKGLSHQIRGKYNYQIHNGTFFEMTLPVTIKTRSHA